MDEICLVVPITPGRSKDARAFLSELDDARRPDYERSERRIGIDKEVWYLAHTAAGDQLVSYMESPNFTRALHVFSHSQDHFDLWFKHQLAHATGLDLNNPPEVGLPEKLSSYSAH
jgi:hypothetical protein